MKLIDDGVEKNRERLSEIARVLLGAKFSDSAKEEIKSRFDSADMYTVSKVLCELYTAPGARQALQDALPLIEQKTGRTFDLDSGHYTGSFGSYVVLFPEDGMVVKMFRDTDKLNKERGFKGW